MIYTVYTEKDDMTFIMQEDDSMIEVVGFYFGEPNEDLTELYKGKRFAEKGENKKKEWLVQDIQAGIKYANEAIEKNEYFTDGTDDFHRGMLAAYTAVLRSIKMIDSGEPAYK